MTDSDSDNDGVIITPMSEKDNIYHVLDQEASIDENITSFKLFDPENFPNVYIINNFMFN